MGRKRAHVPLNVFLNGRLVGVLRREATGAIDFRYEADWLAWDSTFPISLSLPLREDRYIGTPVINVFDNLLPDSDPIRKRVAERVGAEGTDAYSLLTALGHDCVGALQFLPDGVDPGTVGSADGKAVSDDDIADIIKNLASAPLGMGEDENSGSRSLARRKKPRCCARTEGGSNPRAPPPPPISSNRKSARCRTASTCRTVLKTNISA